MALARSPGGPAPKQLLGAGAATEHAPRPALAPWLRVLLTGAGLWAVAVSALALSSDNYIVASIVLGCFVVPVAWTVRVQDRNPQARVPGPMVRQLFVVGGALGFLSSAVAESHVQPAGPLLWAVFVGATEEAVKLAALAVLTRHMTHGRALDGLVLGAVLGFGFAAFESSGYALSTLTSHASTQAMEWTVLTRAVITPVSHGLWTAIAGAALFQWRATGYARRRLDRFVLPVTAVVALHAGWDLVPRLSNGLGLALTGSGHPLSLFRSALPDRASPATQIVASVLDIGGLLLLAGIGMWLAHGARCRARAELGGTGPGRVGDGLAGPRTPCRRRVAQAPGHPARSTVGPDRPSAAVPPSVAAGEAEDGDVLRRVHLHELDQ